MRLHQPILSAVVGLAVLVSSPVTTVAPFDDAAIYVNGQRVVLPDPPTMVKGQVMVPLRAYVEALGGSMNWEPPATITANLQGAMLEFQIGSPDAIIAGRKVKMEVPLQLWNDQPYIPLAFLQQELDEKKAPTAKGGSAPNPADGAAGAIQQPDQPPNPTPAPSAPSPQPAPGTVINPPRGTPNIPTTATVTSLGTVITSRPGFLEVDGTCLGAMPLMETTLFAPVRVLVEQLGGEVSWTGEAAVAKLGRREAVFTPGAVAAKMNGQAVMLPSAVRSINGSVLVPVRALADALGVDLQWDDPHRTAKLRTGRGVQGDLPCGVEAPLASYVVMDGSTGVVLSESVGDTRLPIASTTKVVTALVALEQGKLESVVTVSSKAASTSGTSAYLSAGDHRTLRDLLYGLMLPSGNDAAVAIAEHLAGSELSFAQLMNKRAVELGADRSTFTNASGLDDTARSTARDLAKITRHALTLAEFRKVVGAVDYRSGDGTAAYHTRNDFITTYDGATGVKNGWTEEAGYTLVASAVRDGREVIVVALGAKYRDELYSQATRLMDYGFRLAGRSWALK